MGRFQEMAFLVVAGAKLSPGPLILVTSKFKAIKKNSFYSRTQSFAEASSSIPTRTMCNIGQVEHLSSTSSSRPRVWISQTNRPSSAMERLCVRMLLTSGSRRRGKANKCLQILLAPTNDIVHRQSDHVPTAISCFI